MNSEHSQSSAERPRPARRWPIRLLVEENLEEGMRKGVGVVDACGETEKNSVRLFLDKLSAATLSRPTMWDAASEKLK